MKTKLIVTVAGSVIALGYGLLCYGAAYYQAMFQLGM